MQPPEAPSDPEFELEIRYEGYNLRVYCLPIVSIVVPFFG